ncbi:MAG: hypothetical protein RR942_06595 [Romboutsia sp.]
MRTLKRKREFKNNLAKKWYSEGYYDGLIIERSILSNCERKVKGNIVT